MNLRVLIVALACLLCGSLSARAEGLIEYGIASVHSHSETASGEADNASLPAAAHRTLPFGTLVEVRNLENGRSVVVRINDRGPFAAGRVIDLNKAAAEALGISGLVRVAVKVLPEDC